MTREEKIARARVLRDRGRTYKEIAEDIGMALSTVAEWFVPQNNERKRRWEKEHRATCPDCGGPMSAGSARADGSTSRKAFARCHSCRLVAAEMRQLEAVRLRCEDGLSNGDIAERLGTTKLAVATLLHRAR